MTHVTRTGDSYVQDDARAISSASAQRLGAGLSGALATGADSRRLDGVGAPAARPSLSASPRPRAHRRHIVLIASAITVLTLGFGVTLASAAAPTVTIEPATTVEYTSAKVKGEVDSSEQPTSWRFQYVTDALCEENVNVNSLPCFEGATDGPAGNLESGVDTISRKLTGLAPNTTYHLRLLAENGDGTDFEEAASTFKTQAVTPPVVSNVEAPAVAVEYTRTKVNGTVELANSDPAFNASTCRFEYVTQAEWEANSNAFPEPEGAPSAGCDIEPAGAGSHEVKAQLTGLASKSVYHLRLLAGNQSGEPTKVEAAGTFETLEVTPPSVTIEASGAITSTGAHFSGHVAPNAPGAAPQDPGFDVTWHFECVAPGPTVCPGLHGGTIPADDTNHAVADDAVALQPNQSSPGYTVVLVAENGVGQKAEASATFTTPGEKPLVRAFAAGPVQSEAVGLNGEVNPRNSATVYWFEWGTANCETNPCQSIPASQDASAGAGPGSVYVSRQLTGLSPQTTYHFRLVAENAVGTTPGDDQTFTTASLAGESPTCDNGGAPGAGFLPDCRAWEMVSPLAKNGNDVMADSARTHAAADGNGVAFSSLGAFAEPAGTGVAVEYIARRTGAPATNGWATHAITPQQQPLTAQAVLFGKDPMFEGDFSPDLDRAVYRAWQPLTDAHNVEGVPNYYLAKNLLTPGAAQFDLASEAFAPLGSSPFGIFYRPWIAGASSDLSHVVFESTKPLTPDASGANNLYESVDGEVRLAGRVPASGTSCDDEVGPACVAAGESQAGLGAANSLYTKSMVSADGSRVFFRDNSTGNVYMREDGIRTVQLNASEKAVPDPPQEAELWTASAAGSRVFFTTGESLLEEDENGAADLYMYDLARPAGERLTLVSRDRQPADGLNVSREVIGASADGGYVYFTASGQLLANQPSLAGTGFYVWHDGDLNLIGTFADPGEPSRNGPHTSWGFLATASNGRVTPDGRHLLFMVKDQSGFDSHGGLAPYDHGSACTFDTDSGGPCRELYLYSADSGRLACISCDPGGDTATGDALVRIRASVGVTNTSWHSAHALSDSGRYVFFSTSDSLVSEDTNGKIDAYSYDSQTGEVHLISSGTDTADSYFLDASDSGRDVFFSTRQRLAGWDTDNSYDLYDARVDGGFPEPALAPAPCSADGCRAASPAAPAASAPASAELRGPGNPHHRCPKGKVRKNGKCIKHRHKQKHRRRHHAGRAGAGTGGSK